MEGGNCENSVVLWEMGGEMPLRGRKRCLIREKLQTEKVLLRYFRKRCVVDEVWESGIHVELRAGCSENTPGGGGTIQHNRQMARNMRLRLRWLTMSFWCRDVSWHPGPTTGGYLLYINLFIFIFNFICIFIYLFFSYVFNLPALHPSVVRDTCPVEIQKKTCCTG